MTSRLSRLDRLVTILDTGSTQHIRNTAAQQLADIQEKHPDELFNLLTRIVSYLKSKNWDTRIAAAKAIGGIVENAARFDPNADDDDPVKQEHGELKNDGLNNVKQDDGVDVAMDDDVLRLETLDLAAILSQGQKLLGSAGKEYDYMLAAMDPAQRLAHQKKNLTARLGLGGAYTDEDLIDDLDVKMQTEPLSPKPTLSKINTSLERSYTLNSAAGSVDSPYESSMQTPVDGSGLSKRQLNMLKRKTKRDLKFRANKVQVVDLDRRRPSINGGQAPQLADLHIAKREHSPDEPAKTSPDYFSLERKGEDDNSKVVAEFKGPAAPTKSELQPETDEDGSEWPLDRLCEYLMVDMFDRNWEIRHGAIMCLREIVRVHGAGAGRQRGRTRIHNNTLNKRWLEDLACRLCCVFMLDRFGDYVSDNVVAPIRETAGQALGALVQYLNKPSLNAIHSILYQLIMQEDLGAEKRIWQVCHGGMIGLRYLVAVRADIFLQDQTLMDAVLRAVMKGLVDWDDDVRAVSAATLIPIAADLVQLCPLALSPFVTTVWTCLSDLSDDLSASTGSVMDLLASLCSFPEVLDVMKDNAVQDPEQSFEQLVPRLYVFLRHTITSVRSAVLRALLTFLAIKSSCLNSWVDGKALRLIFQNILVERNEAVLKLSLEVWNIMVGELALPDPDRLVLEFTAHLNPVVALALHPVGLSRSPIPMDPSLFIRPSGQVFVLPSYTSAKSSPRAVGEPPAKRRRKSQKGDGDTPPPVPLSVAHNTDGPMIQGDIDLVGMDVMVRSKIYASRAMGMLMSRWPTSSRFQTFSFRIPEHLHSPYSTTRLMAALIVEEYSKMLPEIDELARILASATHPLVEEMVPLTYVDLKHSLEVAATQCASLRNTFLKNANVPESKLPNIPVVVDVENPHNKYAFTMQIAERFVGEDFDRLKKLLTPTTRLTASKQLEDARADAQRVIDEVNTLKDQRDVAIRAVAAAAIVALNDVPKKPSSTIKALMDSIKTEENIELQKRSASAVVALVQQLISCGKRVIVDKVVGNLTKFYCVDTTETPDFNVNVSYTDKIMSLMKEEDIITYKDQTQREQEVKVARVQRRGAREALEQLCLQFADGLFEALPVLLSIVEAPLKETFDAELPLDFVNPDNSLGQQAVDAFSICRALITSLAPGLYISVLRLFPYVVSALKSQFAVLRYAAAKCFATICSVITVQGFTALVKDVLPSFTNAHNVHQRQGAIECIYHLIQVMEDRILPYVVFLIVPVLGRMSDSDTDVRLIATTVFAKLVKLVPLEAGIPDPPGLSEELLLGRDRERQFMAQMLDPKKVETFQIPVAIKATLRSYQQEGVNWLAFLNRYHLHGILCDDMGLGKTLQTLCIVASDHHMRAEEYARTQNPDVRRLPSLVVCPPTLSGHWLQEIRAYARFLKAVAYVGPPDVRLKVIQELQTADIVITSYEICRNDIDKLTAIRWNYCVLDEGHLIKNPTAKTTLAVKSLASNHRLILSGTPIQNNVLELWSLFDFLMPGFLGTERVFKERFAKPIANSRFSKASSKQEEAGALAVEALHKQVLPFLLRRLKEEVLDDLPPKIIQNYYCDLSDLQRKLFEDFNKKERKTLSELATSGDKEAKQHIFVALNYMRKLCNSPALVMKQGHKQYEGTQAYLKRKGTHVHDPIHAPKLSALRDLLLDCGIGVEVKAEDKEQAATMAAVSQHRALIFCQMKEMLDIVQKEVFGGWLPSATYLRLDGSVEASKRQDLVDKFNGDPSIDVLLLTTSVGGLGLNLTGADTVIFVEHDWNPQKDIQAMDRAHRIGQKKVVNVHRLITRGTLEEKIMNLQRFKIDVASTVVNQQNAGLATMETDQILDLFNLGETADGSGEQSLDGVDAVDEITGEVREKGKKGFLDGLDELWDERQYEEEYDLGGFLQKMKA